ncbi:MAG TPA: nucleotidyltransferase family protein [Chloroflexota bacterium]|jgi:molybdenum cofactor cytidylyltransferase|nr:nucleotidyltransferase family protein [Chloroflexota bacterium]
MSTVAGILLAAGQSTRLGQPKQLLPYRGRSLLRHAAEVGLAAGLAPLIVVIGAAAPAMRRELEGLAVQVVENPRYAEGQSTSLRAGVAALPPGTAAVVILLVDMPAVDAEVIARLVEAWRATAAPIVRPAYAGQPGHPVLFAAPLLPELAAVQGDEGGRAVLRRHAATTHLVPVATPGVLQDIDTWEAYRSLCAQPVGEGTLSGTSGGNHDRS